MELEKAIAAVWGLGLDGVEAKSPLTVWGGGGPKG